VEAAPKPVVQAVPVRPRSLSLKDMGIIIGSILSGLALTWLVLERLSPASGPLGFGVMWFASFLLIYYLVVRETEGKIAAADRAIAALVTGGAAVVVVPLLLIVSYTFMKGIGALRLHFFIQDLSKTGPLDAATAGGALHAIVGSIQQVLIATVIAVPLGVLTAVYLNEVGGRMRHPVRIVVTSMSGVPSILAGLFIFAAWIAEFGHGFSGLAAAFALTILMLPIVTLTAAEVLRLVPDGLREASFALGGPEWRTVWQVVLPTARTGLLTAVLLGIARVVGETAPLLVTSLGASVVNWNPFSGPQDSLPHFVWDLIRSPLPAQIARAWTGALVLIGIVLTLFVTARWLGGRAVDQRRKAKRRKAKNARKHTHTTTSVRRRRGAHRPGRAQVREEAAG
jgi:phosphate transport system permease protein